MPQHNPTPAELQPIVAATLAAAIIARDAGSLKVMGPVMDAVATYRAVLNALAAGEK